MSQRPIVVAEGVRPQVIGKTYQRIELVLIERGTDVLIDKVCCACYVIGKILFCGLGSMSKFVNSQGRVIPALVARREAEIQLFLS